MADGRAWRGEWPTCRKCQERPVRAWKNDPSKSIADGCCYECSWERDYDQQERERRVRILAALSVDLGSWECLNSCGREAGLAYGSGGDLRWLFCGMTCRDNYLAPLREQAREAQRAASKAHDILQAFTLPVPAGGGR